MKEHVKIIKNLSAYLDKELDDKTLKLVQEHLNNCSDCKHELELFSKTNESINKLPEIEPSFYFDNKLKQKIQENIKKESWSQIISNKIQWVPVLVTSLLVIFILFQIGSFAITLSAKDNSVIKNVRTMALKDLVVTPKILNFSSLINFCDSCYSSLCQCLNTKSNCCDIKDSK